MKIIKEIIKSIEVAAPAKKIFVGLHWTYVESQNAGLASTMDEPPMHHDKKIRDVGKLHEKEIGKLIRLALSDHLVEASIGLAAINSLIEIDESTCKEMNAFEIIAEKGQQKNIGIIGHFPFVEKLKQHAKNLWVFEKRMQPGDLHASEMENYLPRCDVIGISATTLINHSLTEVLKYCSKDSFKVMLGATTPMIPVLFDVGIDVLSGCKVVKKDLVFSAISQGASFKQIEGIKLLNMFR